jgi:uncharacterized membrane protein
MSILYVLIGFKHFLEPDFFLKIMPPYIPFPLELVYLSGFYEILFGFFLLFKKYRQLAGIGLIILLVAVFPANIYLYQYPEILCAEKSQTLVRLFFQIPLILIAYWHSLDDSPTWFSLVCILLFSPTIVYFLTLEISC